MAVHQLVALILFHISIASSSGQTARALLVAIDKYPETSGWNEIHATNDIDLLCPVLHKHGFKPRNIKILTDNQATKANIVKELQQIAIDSRLGDCVFIHFSCHGQQMIDDNGDEIDGLDEAIIPYDASRRYSKGGYEGQNHLRDDELEELLNGIRRKIGQKGSVTLTLDACHSGTGDRDNNEDVYSRGTAYIFAPPHVTPPTHEDNVLIDNLSSQPGFASLTVIAACMPNQINYEYRSKSNGIYYGSLTYALCNLLMSENKMLFPTFRESLAKKVMELRPRKGKSQTPFLQTTDEKKIFKIGL